MSKPQSSEEKTQIMRQKRDAKTREHFQQYAPVWMVDETVILDEDAIQFEVVFYHPRYGWVKRRYRFDSYNNVLYQKGQVVLDEDAIYDVQSHAPYITADVLNTVNSYGG